MQRVQALVHEAPDNPFSGSKVPLQDEAVKPVFHERPERKAQCEGDRSRNGMTRPQSQHQQDQRIGGIEECNRREPSSGDLSLLALVEAKRYVRTRRLGCGINNL